MAADGLVDGPRFQNAVLALLQGAESALLNGLHALGFAPDVHGQPGWPFAGRLATETLAMDGGLTRQVAIVVAGLLLALILTGAAVAWRSGRWPLVGAALALLVALPWPSAALVLTDAHATSFHRSPTGFDVASIARGLSLYGSRCASCHGSDGRGEGPRAASLPMWPPRLSSELLWRRAEGEVFWRILHGMRDRHGAETMPGFTGRLDDTEVWALIDAMRVIAAGTGLRADATWSEPVRVPDAVVRCDDAPERRLSSLRGQRLRLVATDGSRPPPREDPRLVTIEVMPTGTASRESCAIHDPRAYAVFAAIAGARSTDSTVGAQFIVDRDGWLRAYGRPGRTEWSSGDLICRSDSTPGVKSGVDGLGDLITAIDADPVRSAALGVAHRR